MFHKFDAVKGKQLLNLTILKHNKNKKFLSIKTLEQCTAKRVAVFFGLLSTLLIVIVTILAVLNANMSKELTESKAKMEVLELYIQSMIAAKKDPIVI